MTSDLVLTRERCHSCAFRPQTEAHQSPFTLLKGILCAETDTPFYCHETLDNGKPTQLCAGWLAARDGRIRNRVKDEPRWKVVLREKLLRIVIEEEDRLIAGHKASSEDLFASRIRAEVAETAIETNQPNVSSIYEWIDQFQPGVSA